MRLGHLFIILTMKSCITRNGDCGVTSCNCLVGKDDVLVETLGCYDELNATIGVISAFSRFKDTKQLLNSVQDDIHTICAEIAEATEKTPRINNKHIEQLEKMISKAETMLETRKSFVVPGGSREAALMHLGRTAARRAERQLVKLSKTKVISSVLLSYANRISSFFYVMSLLENKRNGITEKKPVYRFQQ
jgi:ATP:cob(I)alamin adenosyltransferase